jgi:hypothetical protein
VIKIISVYEIRFETTTGMREPIMMFYWSLRFNKRKNLPGFNVLATPY